jgi:hypothetical protein
MKKEFELKNFIYKTLKEFLSESLKYNGDDILQNDEILFHGTSMEQWNKIVKNNFMVSGFYVGDSEDNIARNYAEIQSRNDNSDGVIIVMNSEFLIGDLIDDYHGDDRQIGQYIFNGNIKKAIHTVKNIETGKIILTYGDLEK